MGVDFTILGPIDYIVHCYEAIPKEELSHREAFLTLFLERHFLSLDPKVYHAGNSRNYHASGREELDRMLESTIEQLEPQFYLICKDMLGYNPEAVKHS